MIRFLADSYEQSQRLRIETGERIRAVLQGRDRAWGNVLDGFTHPHKAPKGDTSLPCDRCKSILEDIGKGKSVGPVPILGSTYQRHWTGERECFAAMNGALAQHLAWAWLKEVKGIGATLACKLLARLDIHKADTPSAFWAYCGLATVLATLYHCEVCGMDRAFPVGYKVTGKHTKLKGSRACKGLLVAAGEGRCAQPKPGRGQKAPYDQYAKKICYLIAMQFIKARGCPYEGHYRSQRAKAERERPGWSAGRIHLTALRKTEKLFLSHLWLVWREAEGLPVTVPYAQAHGHDSYIGPWEMVKS